MGISLVDAAGGFDQASLPQRLWPVGIMEIFERELADVRGSNGRVEQTLNSGCGPWLGGSEAPEQQGRGGGFRPAARSGGSGRDQGVPVALRRVWVSS